MRSTVERTGILIDCELLVKTMEVYTTLLTFFSLFRGVEDKQDKGDRKIIIGR